ncbi:MAG: hypothetical protein KDI79_07960 [Anaerolineae bacterium]|nr:hypothetical protein [Anaerolineae bacterium]
MKQYTLVALDVTGIQGYIFNSNRLKENIGASELVYRVTRQWVFDEVPTPNNVTANGLDDNLRIEAGNIVAEVIYAGGGNAFILFVEAAAAEQFISELSLKIISEAPGLELVAATVSFDWDTQPLGDPDEGQMKAVVDTLTKNKRTRTASVPLLGLGVTAACQSTGLPAVYLEPDEGYPISAQVRAKIDSADEATQRLQETLGAVIEAYEIPKKFDELGRQRGESSYIAVVHADGNSISKTLQRISEDYDEAGDDGNRAFINAIRTFAHKLERASKNALEAMIEILVAAIDESEEGQKGIGDTVFLVDNYLPCRPIVFGGDDVTFVCDGRLGLSLAACYLYAFEQETKKEGLNCQACAGVAVVKSHYPFARAYQLSEALAGSAKKYVRDNGDGFSALDWHFAETGLLGDLNDIRRREYEWPDPNSSNSANGAYQLYMRPIRLHAHAQTWRTWPNFVNVINGFNTSDAENESLNWAGKRNKIMGLYQALREGSVSVRQFRTAYGLASLPEMSAAPDRLAHDGWDGKTCGYFDPIEALDFFVTLNGQEVQNGTV